MLGSLVFGLNWKWGVRVCHGCIGMLEILTCMIVLVAVRWGAGASD